MTIVSDDPTWWSFISSSSFINYFVAASSTMVIYDWALTFGQEFELILRRRWSFMSVLYICVRYIGILFSAINILCMCSQMRSLLLTGGMQRFSLSQLPMYCIIIWYIGTWTPVIVNAMLGVTMIARINAMYLGSKKLLIFLAVTLLACTITSGVMVVIGNLTVSAQEAILSGHYICFDSMNMHMTNLTYESVISTAVWEILALFLTVWIVMKHFRQSRTGSAIERFKMLTQSHVFYFLAFAAMASLRIGSVSLNIMTSLSMGSDVFSGIWAITEVLQLFVLGPRLILSIREYHAKLVANTRADRGIAMTSFSAFQAS
ncbi:hypothetical protein BDR03DRAFT_738534 [Suillus americanus]|nr:hypothetical protein BDR03DRAFT_738534 [Suillus americanus]